MRKCESDRSRRFPRFTVMLTPHGHTFSIKSRGQTWSGAWELDGKDVRITSAFGSCRAPKGRKPPEKVAAEALSGLVDAWVLERSR